MASNMSYSLALSFKKNTPPADKEINESLRDFFPIGHGAQYLWICIILYYFSHFYHTHNNEAFTKFGPFRRHIVSTCN